jgi:hypothetical protein
MKDIQKFSQHVIDYAERLADMADAAQGRGARRTGHRTRWLILPAVGGRTLRLRDEQPHEGRHGRREGEGLRAARGSLQARAPDNRREQPEHEPEHQPQRLVAEDAVPPEQLAPQVGRVALTRRGRRHGQPALVSNTLRQQPKRGGMLALALVEPARQGPISRDASPAASVFSRGKVDFKNLSARRPAGHLRCRPTVARLSRRWLFAGVLSAGEAGASRAAVHEVGTDPQADVRERGPAS